MSNVARTRMGLRILAAFTGVPFVLLVAYSPIADTIRGGDGTGDTAVAVPSKSFTIEGNATEPISPGFSASLDLKLTNPQDFPLTVTGLRVTVQKVRAPNADDVHPCGVGDFAVDQSARSLKIFLAMHSTSTLSSLGRAQETWPRVGMRNRPVNQDGCKGASLTLAYTASGTGSK